MFQKGPLPSFIFDGRVDWHPVLVAIAAPPGNIAPVWTLLWTSKPANMVLTTRHQVLALFYHSLHVTCDCFCGSVNAGNGEPKATQRQLEVTVRLSQASSSPRDAKETPRESYIILDLYVQYICLVPGTSQAFTHTPHLYSIKLPQLVLGLCPVP